jgi:hypothetical protein
VAVIIIWLLIDTCRRVLNKPVHYLPRVLTALPDNGINNLPVLILGESELFGHGSLVTVFYVDQNGIELQVGSGQVSTIQMDRKIQVEVTHWAKRHETVLQAAITAQADTLQRVLVKPTITSSVIGEEIFRRLSTEDGIDESASN